MDQKVLIRFQETFASKFDGVLVTIRTEDENLEFSDACLKNDWAGLLPFVRILNHQLARAFGNRTMLIFGTGNVVTGTNEQGEKKYTFEEYYKIVHEHRVCRNCLAQKKIVTYCVRCLDTAYCCVDCSFTARLAHAPTCSMTDRIKAVSNLVDESDCVNFIKQNFLL